MSETAQPALSATKLKWIIAIVIALIVALLGWDTIVEKTSNLPEFNSRATEGVLTGRMPKPADAKVLRSLLHSISPRKKSYRLMVMKHIPEIAPGTPMPHPFVGDCINCHLFQGGPGAGSQDKLPVGALLEQMSRMTKLGPPLTPTTKRPHPPAGRCIKCHDIIVKVDRNQKGRGFML
ncbi:MAG: magnetochrome domain-containing protein [Mariprofundus sp.]|nr:magnetochrome domain-containing protein [Mariprofundus sp.]